MGLFDKLFSNREVYTDLEIVDGAIKDFPGLDTKRLPKEVTKVIYADGNASYREGNLWMYSEDSALEAFLTGEED